MRGMNYFQLLQSRQYDNRHQLSLASALRDSCSLLQRLQLDSKIDAHTGCVNSLAWNETGSLLLSGSDDHNLVFSDPFRSRPVTVVSTPHTANIFSAKFLPGSSDTKLVSCAGDGLIAYTDLNRIQETAGSTFHCHAGTVYELLSVPEDPYTFLSCGEDGTVRWFDTRTKTSCDREDCQEDVLISCQRGVSSISINPVLPSQLAVGCADASVRIYDRRMLGTRLTGGCDNNSGLTALVSKFTVPEFEGAHRRITSVDYRKDGQEVLASYSSDYIYIFDPKESREGKGKKLKVGRPVKKKLSARGRNRSPQPMKKLRLRGDWSDTGPNSRPETEIREGAVGPVNAQESDRSTVQAQLLQRMTEALSRMLNDPGTRMAMQSLNSGSGESSSSNNSGGPTASETSNSNGDSSPETEGSNSSRRGDVEQNIRENLHLGAGSSQSAAAATIQDRWRRFRERKLQSRRETVIEITSGGGDASSEPGTSLAAARGLLTAMQETLTSQTTGGSLGMAETHRTDTEEERPGREEADQLTDQGSRQVDDGEGEVNNETGVAADDRGVEGQLDGAVNRATHNMASSWRTSDDEGEEKATQQRAVVMALEACKDSGKSPQAGIEPSSGCDMDSARLDDTQEAAHTGDSRMTDNKERQTVQDDQKSAEAGNDHPNGSGSAVVEQPSEPNENMESLETTYTSLRDNGVEPTLEFRYRNQGPTASWIAVGESPADMLPGPSRVVTGPGQVAFDPVTGARRRRTGISSVPTSVILPDARETRPPPAPEDVSVVEYEAESEDEMRDDDDEEEEESENWESRGASSSRGRVGRTIIQPPVRRRLTGHRNARTMIKEATWWGNNFVLSGSDCGHLFGWDRNTGDMVLMLEADRHVVNCVAPHPTLPLVATSGIDYDIKLWAPTAPSCQFDRQAAEIVARRNEVMLEETRDTITVPASLMIRMLASLNQIRRGQPQRPVGGQL